MASSERGFIGGTQDKTTGLTHIGAREYDPAAGRFLSVDPLMVVDDPRQHNAYQYANNSPLTNWDPTGLALDDGTGHSEKADGSSPSNPVTPGGKAPNGTTGDRSGGPQNTTSGGGTGGTKVAGTDTGTSDTTPKNFFLGAPLTTEQYNAMTKQGYQGSQNYTADEATEWTAILGCVAGGSKIEACRKESDAKKNATGIEVFINDKKDGISIANQIAGDTATLGLLTAAGCGAYGNLPCAGAAASVTKWAFVAKAATRVPLVINACGAFSEGSVSCTEQSIGLGSDLLALGTGFIGEGIIAGYIADRIVVTFGFRGMWR